MSIRKQEFYEGAALHLLVRSGRVERLTYDPPFFSLNARIPLLLKYSTHNRSPWGFTFTPQEQAGLQYMANPEAVIGLICGHDGVAAMRYSEYLLIAPISRSAIHISCFRKHREHYELSGPAGLMPRRISPSLWARILD